MAESFATCIDHFQSGLGIKWDQPKWARLEAALSSFRHGCMVTQEVHITHTCGFSNWNGH